MAKARGKVEQIDLVQVSGLDNRIWQKEGSSTDNVGVLYSLKGEVVKSPGIQPLVDWALPDRKEGSYSQVWPFYDPSLGKTYPLMSIGSFNMNGSIEILLEFGGRVAVVRSNSIEVIATGRRVAKRPSEGTQFVQVGNAVLILNGFDENLKWDGKKVSPLGLSAPPSAPACPSWSDGSNPGGIAVSADSTNAYPGEAIEKTPDDRVNEYKYKMTWVNDQGSESEDSAASEAVTDRNITPSGSTDKALFVLVSNLAQDPNRPDVTGRRLYRADSTGQQYSLIADLPGTHSETFLDTTDVTYSSSVTLPAPGQRLPPPVARFAISFKQTTFYAGNPANPTLLYYSLGLGQKESVPQPGNVIQIATEDGSDHITAMAVVSDYALVFTKRSIHMVTMDKAGVPILTPISQTIGASGCRAVSVFEGIAYFFSAEGLFAFDGSSPRPLSSELNQQISSLPEAFLGDVVAFVDPSGRRVCFSVCAGPGSENNEVWAVHIDTGAVSKVRASVFDAMRYKDETLVSFAMNHKGPILTKAGGQGDYELSYIANKEFRLTDLGMWGCLNSIAETDPIEGFFDTRWLIGSNPEADKTFHRMDLFYVQTGDYPLTISWQTNWKNKQIGSTTVSMKDPDALVWGEELTGTQKRTWDDVYPPGFVPSSLKDWDEKRLRSVRLDMPSSSTSREEDSGLTAKSIKFRFGVEGSDPHVSLPLDRRWRIVGFVLFYSDHGVRAEGTDTEAAS